MTLALARVVELLCARPPEIVHNHMYRAEVIGTRAALELGRLGLPRPYVVSTDPLEPRSERGGSGAAAPADAVDGSADRGQSGDRRQAGREGRTGAPVELIYNGVDLKRYDVHRGVLHAARGVRLPGGIAAGRRRRAARAGEGPCDAARGVAASAGAVPEARLLIIGEGSQREMLEAQAEAMGLLGEECSADRCVGTRGARPGAKVLFTGLRDDVPAVTAALDVAVLPSYREAQGLAILEAMALRRPVVATAVGGVPEMIEHGRTGLLVPPHDAAALAAAIARVLTDHPLADMLARAGHDFVHANFSVERMAGAVARIYEEGAALVATRNGAALTAA